jgi:hypothetical protein
MPLGTYSFSNNSIIEKCRVQKNILVPKSFLLNLIPMIGLCMRQQGSFTIKILNKWFSM